MKKIVLSFTYLLLNIGLSYSQGVIRDINTKDFPDVSFVIHSNNPENQDSTKIQIEEEKGKGSNVKLVPLDSNEQGGILDVLFLWDLKGKVSFVPELLADFFNKMEPSDSLRVNVAIFSRNKEGEKVYEFLLESFDSDLEKARDAIYLEAGKVLSYKSSSSDIIWALDKALDQISNPTTEGPKAIVLCSEGKNNMDSGFDVSAIVNKARKNRVLIYVVNIEGGEVGETLSEKLTSATYGLSLVSDGSFETKQKRDTEMNNTGNENLYPFLFSENETIKAWINDLPKRWKGVTYQVTYVSSYERINQTKPLTVYLGEETFVGSIHVPGVSMGLWIKNHLILFIIILVVSLVVVGIGLFFLIRHLRDVAADKREERAEREAERKKLKSDQETLRRKLEIAESEQRRMLEKENARKKLAERNEKLASLNTLMHAKNIRARVLITTMSESSEEIITNAETTIGTAEDNEIVIMDPTVSRHHAILYFDGEKFGIRDLNSTNGIVMNGFKMKDLKLRNGDTVSLGNTTIKIYF